jgi:hypothetical protein
MKSSQRAHVRTMAAGWPTEGLHRHSTLQVGQDAASSFRAHAVLRMNPLARTRGLQMAARWRGREYFANA